METFTYHKRAKALHLNLKGLLAYAVAELTVWAIVISIMPKGWALGTTAVLLLLVLWQASFSTRCLRNAHRLNAERLEVNFGHWYGILKLQIPLKGIEQADRFEERLPPGIGVGIEGLPRYRDQDDTLYLLTEKGNCVSLRFDQPLDAKLGKQGLVQFTRVVMTLDEPGLFLRRLAEYGVAAEAAPEVEPTPLNLPPTGHTLPPVPGPTEEPPAIELHHLHKRYGAFTAVADLSLTVQPGEILAFLSSNGAGKTTTINMITGLLEPTGGQVLIHGRDIRAQGPGARRLLGYVPDVPLLHEGLTAREFLWMMAGLYDLSPTDGRKRTDELLSFLGMERWGDHQIRGFSLGMKRKMSIAAALVHHPRVLLLDEVTNGLDPRAARDVKDFIMHTARQGTTVLLTTHLLETAQELAHRIAIIDSGRLKALGTLEELRAQANLPQGNLEAIFLHFTESQTKVGVSA